MRSRLYREARNIQLIISWRLSVPVGREPHRDHDLLDPCGVLGYRVARSEGLGHKRKEAALGVRSLPAPQRRPAALTQVQGGGDALLASGAQQARTLAHEREDALARSALRRPTTAGCQEAEP